MTGDFFSFIFEQGMLIIVGLGAVLAILILAYKKTPSPTGLPQQLRGPQPSGSHITENNQVILPEQQLTKEEQWLQTIVKRDSFDIETVEPIKAFGAKYKITSRKPEPLVPFAPEITQEEVELLEKHHSDQMKGYVKKIKSPEKPKKTTDEGEPEEPEKGWEEYLEETIGDKVGNAEK